MKKIYCILFLSGYIMTSSCNVKAPEYGFQTYANSFIYASKEYCLSFQLDSMYRITDTLNGLGWGATRAYRFISSADTISIRLYIDKYDKSKGEASFVPTKGTQEKLRYDYDCAISYWERADAFFKGVLVGCQGEKSSIMTYSGANHTAFGEDEIGIYIVSEGQKEISKTRLEHFKSIIGTIKIRFESM